jgi:hypothetical protein
VRVAVYVDNLQLGGAQWSALDLAGGLAGAGHDVRLVSTPGPLADLAGGIEVRLVEAEPHPSRRVARALGGAVADRDVVYAIGSAATLEAVTGSHTPVVSGYPGDHLPAWVPRTPPLVAWRQSVLKAAPNRRVHRLPAAVDTDRNHPGVDGSRFRVEHRPGDGVLGVLVSRLQAFQQAGLVQAVAAAGRLAARRPFRLVVVGDGKLRAEVEAAAAAAGSDAVRLVGAMVDPGPAYAAADVVLGMGTSVLRGMAHARPAVVLGVDGAAVVAEPASHALLTDGGWNAPGPPGADVADLLEQALGRPELGPWGRGVVVAERAPAVVAAQLTPVLAEAVAHPPSRAARRVDLARSWARWGAGIAADSLRRRLPPHRSGR